MAKGIPSWVARTRSSADAVSLHEKGPPCGAALFFCPEYDGSEAELDRPAPGLGVARLAGDQPDIARRDNWRREVIDADAFDPALASHLLITPQELPAALCGKGAAWVVGDAQAPRWLPLLAQTPPVFSEHGQTLWRVDTRRGSPCLAAQKRPVAAQQIGSAGDQYEHGGE